MRRLLATAVVLAALAAPHAAASDGAGSAGAAARACSADSEVGPRGTIAFGFRCPSVSLRKIVIDGGSDIRQLKGLLRVDPADAAKKAPACSVQDGGKARCVANVEAGALVTGWLKVAGDPCEARLTFTVAGPDGQAVARAGAPKFC